jgi:hypothetical protein
VSDTLPPAAPNEHDAWLRQALRHAPDAAAAPPQALREAILAEARSAVQPRRRPASRPSLADRAAAFWSWLAWPAVAAGFASVMAATLVGLMWWDQPMDETLPPSSSRRVEPEAAAPVAPTGTDVVPSPRPAPMPQPAATPLAPEPAATKRAVAALAKTAPAGTAATEPRKDQVAANAVQTAPSPSPFPGTGSGTNAAAARDQAAAPALAKQAESQAVAAAAEPPQPAAMQPPPAAPAETTRRSELAANDAKSAGAAGASTAKPASLSRQRAAPAPREATDAIDASAAAAAQAFAPPPPPVREAAPSQSKVTTDTAAWPMAALLGSIAQGAGRWSRPASGGITAVLDAPTEAWLASVEATTTGRWHAITERTSRLEGALAAEADALPLSRDGRLAAIVRVEEGGVFFELQPGPAWFAPLPPDAVARLRATLAATAR